MFMLDILFSSDLSNILKIALIYLVYLRFAELWLPVCN